MTYRFIIVFIKLTATLIISMVGRAQDPQFSQFYGNPMYLNPALTGNKICPRLTMNYRNQWPSIPASFTTISASYDQYSGLLHGGIGLSFMSDRAGAGILTNTMISGFYAYHMNLSSELTLQAGFQGTYQQITLDWYKLTFEDPSQPMPPSLKKTFPDFSAGLLLGYQYSYYIGFAAHHLTQPSTGFIDPDADKQHMKFTVHAGAIFDIGGTYYSGDSDKGTSVSPNILYQQQGDFRQLNAGLYATIYPFTGGLWYRFNFQNSDAVIALLGFQYDRFKVGYSYDYTVSGLTNATGGSHEVSVAFQLPCPEKRKKIQAIKCPRF